MGEMDSADDVNRLKTTDYFDGWFDGLKDRLAKRRIQARIKNAEAGNFGDCKWNIKDGVSEMRIDYGPGYRLYFCQRGECIYLLLAGGTKDQQQRDIERAVEIKNELEREERW